MAKRIFPTPLQLVLTRWEFPMNVGKLSLNVGESSLPAGKLSLTLLKSCQRLGESFLNAGKSSLNAATSGKAFVLEQFRKQGGGNSPCVAHR